MKMKFIDNTVVTVSNLVEQKIFRGEDSVGWIAGFSIKTQGTSDEADQFLKPENLGVLVVSTDDETVSRQLTGYEKLTSVSARYAEDLECVIDVQISKGV